jgi:phosphoenolpyruvate-protein phosphotransferase (PTS system enzyme I)
MSEEVWLSGISVSEGFAVGIPFFLSPFNEGLLPNFSISDAEVEGEIARYRKAIDFSLKDLQYLHAALLKEGPDDAAQIIETHIQMLSDPLITSTIEERIGMLRKNSEAIFFAAIEEYEKRFSNTKDLFFQQRLQDIRDLSRRILSYLSPQSVLLPHTLPNQTIIFAKELTPSHVAGISLSQVIAFITHLSGGNSHAALIARARGIPYIADVDLQRIQPLHCDRVLVDGSTGTLILNPKEETIKSYQKKLEDCKKTVSLYSSVAVETEDGYAADLYYNVGTLKDLKSLKEQKTCGIGLLRSEYLFFEEKLTGFPSEEQQEHYYQLFFNHFQGLPITIRVFDIGGDKRPSFLEEETHKPFIYQGLRFLLHNRQIFRQQLRAILRAARGHDVRILLPLVSSLCEVQEAKALLQEAYREVGESRLLPMGCMLELPSAFFLCDALARACDFFSIGTNDLIQYTLGMHRSDPSMNSIISVVHPSILRMIRMAILAAARHQIPIRLCGEAASRPQLIPLFLGLGIREFSLSPPYLKTIQNAIRNCSIVEAYQLARQAIACDDAQEITQLIQSFSREI